MAAGAATLRALAEPGAYDRLAAAAREVAASLAAEAERAGVPVQTAAVGGMWGFFLSASPVTDYASAKANADAAQYARFFHACLDEGVYLAPSQFEAAFVSTAHDAAVVHEARAAFGRAFGRMRS